MAKLTRKTQKLFAKNVDKGVFGSFKDGTPTTTTDLDLIQSSDYLNGWIEGYKDNNGDKQAAIEEQNALKYVNDYQNAYLLQEGIAEYDAGTEYHIDSMVKENGTGLIYKSLINTNIGQALSNASKWRKLGNLDQANNVVIVKQESDFKNQDASNIYLRDTNTMYYISVSQLIITKNIVCDLDDLSVAFVGSGLPNTQIIFATIIEIDGELTNKQALEEIILVKVPGEIYPEIRDLFVLLFEKSGFKAESSQNIPSELILNHRCTPV